MAETTETTVARSAGPRERRRTRTKLMIQGEAMRLFALKGYEETTVEEIADAADISSRTFFRYFPTKEDVVVWDEYDPVVPDLLDARPADEPPAETIRAVTREAVAGMYRSDPERLLSRHRLMQSEPEVRARFLELFGSGAAMVAELLGPRRGLPPDDLRLRVTAAALGAAVVAALERWQEDGGKSDLLTLLDEATDALVEGVGELDTAVAKGVGRGRRKR